jgi:hypothetical protein
VPRTASEHIARLSRYADVFKAFYEPGHHARLETFLRRLEAVDTTTVFPFLLYAHAELVPHAIAEFDKILVLLESYLMRRMICHLTGKHYNRYFVDLIRNIDRNGVLSAHAVGEHMAKSNADSIRYPDDKSVSAALGDLPLYGRLGQGKVKAILEALDGHAHTSKSEVQALPPGLTIEHVMPQTWADHWPLDKNGFVDPDTGAPDPLLEQKAQQRRERLIDTLGNLTLITGSLNPALSNSAWTAKRPELMKFSKLNLNQYFHGPQADDWNEAAIERRTAWLCDQLTSIWPSLPQVETAAIQPQRATAAAQAARVGDKDRMALPLARNPDRPGPAGEPIDMASLPGLSSYTGKPPNEFALRAIGTLVAHGFTVAPTDQGPNDQRKTLRISWRGFFIGLMSEGLWGRKLPYACLYRFAKNGGPNSVAKAPQGFDKDAFALQHGCDPDMLHVYSDYSGSYLWIRDEATSLHLMRDWARKIDDGLGGGVA